MANDNGPDNSPDERQDDIIEEGSLNVFLRGLARRQPYLAVIQEIRKERSASESSNRIRKNPMGRVHLAVVAGLILSAHWLEAQEFPFCGWHSVSNSLPCVRLIIISSASLLSWFPRKSGSWPTGAATGVGAMVAVAAAVGATAEAQVAVAETAEAARRVLAPAAPLVPAPVPLAALAPVVLVMGPGALALVGPVMAPGVLALAGPVMAPGVLALVGPVMGQAAMALAGPVMGQAAMLEIAPRPQRPLRPLQRQLVRQLLRRRPPLRPERRTTPP